LKRKVKAEEEINRIIEEINREIDLVVVEGIHDEEVLRLLGYRGEVLRFSSFRGVLSISEQLERNFPGKRVLILTDYDRRGEELNDKIKKALETSRVKINERLRRDLGLLLSKYSIKTIEEARGLLVKDYRLL